MFLTFKLAATAPALLVNALKAIFNAKQNNTKTKETKRYLTLLF